MSADILDATRLTAAGSDHWAQRGAAPDHAASTLGELSDSWNVFVTEQGIVGNVSDENSA